MIYAICLCLSLSRLATIATDDELVDAIQHIKYNKSAIIAGTTAAFMSVCVHKQQTHTDALYTTRIRPHAVKDRVT